MALALGGCAATPPDRPNYAAIETRPLDAPAQRSFDAAIETLFDQGYMIVLADGDARLVAGARNDDGAEAEVYARAGDRCSCAGGCRGPWNQCIVWVRARGPEASEMRVRFHGPSGIAADPNETRRFWEAVQTQLVADRPPRAGASR